MKEFVRGLSNNLSRREYYQKFSLLVSESTFNKEYRFKIHVTVSMKKDYFVGQINLKFYIWWEFVSIDTRNRLIEIYSYFFIGFWKFDTKKVNQKQSITLNTKITLIDNNKTSGHFKIKCWISSRSSYCIFTQPTK